VSDETVTVYFMAKQRVESATIEPPVGSLDGWVSVVVDDRQWRDFENASVTLSRATKELERAESSWERQADEMAKLLVKEQP
jgi:hypothetical protein